MRLSKNGEDTHVLDAQNITLVEVMENGIRKHIELGLAERP